MRLPLLFAPLRRANFRWLWIGMGLSYAGDRLQEMAQSWLVASLTQSAFAVGGIGILAAVPQLLILIGGAIGDRVDRRRLLVTAQLVGALLAMVVALLVLNNRIAVWHIYLWALVSGIVWLFSRPSHKVMLTESVPREEVRPATALNSITESALLLLVAAGGSVILGSLGLAVAFLFNAASYAAAGFCLSQMTNSTISKPSSHQTTQTQLLTDLHKGLQYLQTQPGLLYPFLLTFVTMICVSPVFGLLAAIVHNQGGTIVNLGVLSACSSIGGLIGATTAGTRNDSNDPIRQYYFLAWAAAIALIVFAWFPIGWITPLPLATIGFITFFEAVSNTSRIRLMADSAFQTRLQALATMVFWIGSALGQLWAGIAVDRWGKSVMASGGLSLIVLSTVIFFFVNLGNRQQSQ